MICQRIAPVVLFLLCLGNFKSAQAQFPTAAAYPFTPSQKTFTYLTGGTSVTFGDWDDGYVNNIPIGFSFTFAGTTYTTVTAEANGYMVFGNITVATWPPYGAPTVPCMMAGWDDASG